MPIGDLQQTAIPKNTIECISIHYQISLYKYFKYSKTVIANFKENVVYRVIK